MSPQDRKLLFYLFLAALALGGVFLVGMTWNANSFYTEAYRPQVEQYQREQRENSGEEDSDQPRAPGFREKDIEKHEGRRFRTF